jgi:hypothetical protein
MNAAPVSGARAGLVRPRGGGSVPRIAVLLCVALLLFAVASDAAMQMYSQPRYRLAILGGYAWSSYDDLDDNISNNVGSFHAMLDTLDAQGGDVLYTYFDTDHMVPDWTFGARLEYEMMDNFLVGAQFDLLNGDGGYRYRVDYEDTAAIWSERFSTDYDATGVMLSARGTYVLRPSQMSAGLRIGGGVGWVHGDLRVRNGQLNEIIEDGHGYYRRYSEFHATGNAVAFDAFTGLEFMSGNRYGYNYVVTMDVGYRWAAVDKLKVDTVDDVPGVRSDGTLKSNDQGVFSTTEGSDVGLDFSGAYVSFSIAAMF